MNSKPTTTSTSLKVGSLIAHRDGQMEWVEATITRVSDSYVWFKGSGYDRIKRTTFENYPELFKILAI